MDSQHSTAFWKGGGRDYGQSRGGARQGGAGGWVCERDALPGPNWKELTEKQPEEDCAQS